MPDMRLPFAACRNGDVVDARGGGTFVLDVDNNRIAHFNHGSLEERWAAAAQYAAFRNALEHSPEPVAYLRPVDAGTDNECLFVCAKGDPGSFPVFAEAGAT